MHVRRPFSVSFVCMLAIVGTALSLVLVVPSSSDPIQSKWLDQHPRETNALFVLVIVNAALSFLSAFFMLQARNWARWLHILWGIVFYTVMCWIHFIALLLPGIFAALLSTIILLLPGARQYFITGGKPWWRLEDQSAP